MLNEETVFILGAGASTHYGYPTGEKLIELVYNKAIHIAESSKNPPGIPLGVEYFQNEYNSRHISPTYYQKQIISECNDLVTRIQQINPIKIDSFLEQNPTLQAIGKIMVAWVLLECETQYARESANDAIEDYKSALDKPKGDWIRFLMQALLYNCKSVGDLIKNRFHCITFNYDTSLERYLFTRLCAIDIFRGHEDQIQRFLAYRVIHLYGKIHNDAYVAHELIPTEIPATLANEMQNEEGTTTPWDEYYVTAMNMAYEASKYIRIDSDKKSESQDDLKRSREAIQGSKTVYVLGYGFDENNSKLAGLDQLHKSKYFGRVCFTNFGNRDITNRKAGKLFMGSPFAFLPQGVQEKENNLRYEKSIRKVYGAMAYDFEL